MVTEFFKFLIFSSFLTGFPGISFNIIIKHKELRLIAPTLHVCQIAWIELHYTTHGAGFNPQI